MVLRRPIDNKKVYKEYKEFLEEQFKTREGLFDFFVVTVIWYAIIVQYIVWMLDSTIAFWAGIFGTGLIATYAAYLTLGVIGALIGLILRWALLQVLLTINNGRRRYLKR